MYDVTPIPDLAYAEVDGRALLADLYRPETGGTPPVVVYLHGGGFAAGSRTDRAPERLAAFAAHGVAVLTVDYRLAPSSRFPDQIHDAKAAIRWLRASASEFGVDGERIAAWGASAGGLLAALLGLTSGQAAWEGPVGAHLDRSSSIQAVVTWFGAFDLLASASRSWLESKLLPHEFGAVLLGVDGPADVAGIAGRAREASPLTWVSPSAPPFLIAHGDRDRMCPPSQSQALHDALVRAGARSLLLHVGGAGHEGAEFECPAILSLTASFVASILKPA